MTWPNDRSSLIARVGSALATFTLGACVNTRLLELDNVAAPLPARRADAGWRVELDGLFDVYERSPVLSPKDPRLAPLFGGLTTLSYFGADVQARVVDQELRTPTVAGESLESACARAAPPLVPVWIPLARAGGRAPSGVACDEHGTPIGASAAEAFCMFARLGLQELPERPLIIVVHGLFDSSAQEYVRDMAGSLYELGHSVLVPDMRDHGDTLRAAPAIATSLGAAEGIDLVELAGAARAACPSRITRVGIAGVSGGGLDAIRAFTVDAHGALDAGVIAISPLLDPDLTLRQVRSVGTCPITQTAELRWYDSLGVGAVSGAAFFGGAALLRALDGEPPDAKSALAGGIGATLGLLAAGAVDLWFDGGNTPCIAQHAIAQILNDVVRVRWRSLQSGDAASTMSPAGQHIRPEQVRLDDYLAERAQYQAARLHIPFARFDAVTLARDLRPELARPERSQARLLVLGAEDDPLTRKGPFHAFAGATAGLPQVYARSVTRGGHGAMWIVQPAVMREVLARFFTL